MTFVDPTDGRLSDVASGDRVLLDERWGEVTRVVSYDSGRIHLCVSGAQCYENAPSSTIYIQRRLPA